MDYQTFIEQTSQQVNQMSSSEKTDCLLNLLRLTPETKREQVLQLITDDSQFFEKQYQNYQDYLTKLARKEFHFTTENEEIYDDYYYDWDPDYIIKLYDPENICQKLTEILSFAKQLVYQKHYQKAYDLYILCLQFQFLAYDEEIGETYDYYLNDLINEEFITIDANNIMSHILYSIYQTTDSFPGCIKQFYHYLGEPISRQIKIADIFTVGPQPLKNTEKFLAEWIEFLKLNPAPLADRLLLDAVETSSYFKDPDHLFNLAQEAAKTHPKLYLKCINLFSTLHNQEKAFMVGKDGLKNIPVKNKVRSQVAEEVLNLAQQLNDTSIIHKAVQDAFYSDPQLDTLFPVLKLDLFEQEKRQLLHFVRNDSTVDNRTVLLFFLGEFETVYKKVSTDHRALGWSTSDKGMIIPLFLLLLRPLEFSQAADSVLLEVKHRVSGNPDDSFENEFVIWKNTVSLNEKSKSQYLKWCKKEVKARAKELIITKFRHHYSRMAALIVTLGEAEENIGIPNARAQIIQNYRREHSRKRNFTASLDELT
ncbi:hypothetical protein GCM10025886_19540 [Tetragenococcus halophilus subsp. flandriensis]|uniref:hypothetical protein n=1 Tax=Tetragenococcus halophilus TaxID=51669 RepID=UPI0023EA3BD6|nr:hypothetical protein [Tetragenococcus halophilus]GMA08803.1 hypothetical protein GCM10025886_19540 [Tetragenococcus halophilus subsp. flandriensis]